ncbi:MAG: MarR family winged helix-turn-helix transcriptional regulator [Eggerthia catenaformis]
MDTRDEEFMDVLTNVFKLAMKTQEDYLKNSKFPELSLTEIHVIEAAAKEPFPTMSNVSQRLKITLGTLTTNVKTIIKKGFLYKETYENDKRFTFLRLTSKGFEALEVHDEFHKEIREIYRRYIPEERFNWVHETFIQVENSLIDYYKTLKHSEKI